MNKAQLVDIKFAPIYDSGSSLAREITSDRIQSFLDDDNRVDRYIDKGIPDVKWDLNEKRINHFEMLSKIEEKYPEQIDKTIRKVIKKYKKKDVERIIHEIDVNLAEEFVESKLSLQRKELIIKFVDFRIERLKSIIS